MKTVTPEKRSLLTNSSTGTFKTCRRKYFWAYVCGIRPEYDGRALRMGSAYHKALDVLRVRRSCDDAVEEARSRYALCPDNFNQREWEIERETVAALVNGYAWRWGDSLTVLASEMKFQIRLRNPTTKAPSTLFDLAGVLDGIVIIDDSGRQAVLESKTTGEDISFDSDYWQRLQLDSQPTIYIHGAREKGFAVDTVMWDATKKPTIKPTPVAVCDDLGAKIVLDCHGVRVKTNRGQWRQTNDTAKGYVLQQRDMTPDEWSKRLTADISERPEYYFQRREIPRLDDDIEECRSELWEIQQTLRTAERENKWYKTVGFSTCPHCSYFGLCSSKYNPCNPVPAGLIRVSDIHPELNEDNDAPTSAA